MDLRSFLALLHGVKGPNASGEYTARCPAHDDKTASLCITEKPGRDGKRRIMLDCKAGCTFDAVTGALGVSAAELITEPDDRQNRPQGRKAAPKGGQSVPGLPGVTAYQAKPLPRREANPQTRAAQGPAASPREEGAHTPDWDHPDAVYSYQGPDGAERFQVVRLHFVDGPGKTFRQRIHDPQNPKANREGYVWTVPDALREETLYRLPQLQAGMAAGRPVYVVEGEKDVETLERLGYVATCNPGGAGKWKGRAADSWSGLLRGADVIILPDMDIPENHFTGQEHALDVALSLVGKARRIRLLDLREACPEIPPKGDISDMVQIMGGAAAMDALARLASVTRNFDPQDVPFWLSPMEQAETLYSRVPGYGAENGCIVQLNGATSKKLSDFVVIPRMELTRDDGASQTVQFVLDGWNSQGKRLRRVTITSKALDSMSWITENWGFDASLMPGTTNKDKCAFAIKKVGQMTAKRVMSYSHTGWRKIDGKWAYLYQGGAIGAAGVTVELDGSLRSYRLDGAGVEGFDQITFRDAAEKSLSIQRIMKEQIGIALLGTAYLAPLREFMAQTGIAPAHSLFLHGNSGTHKTTAAALALSHFGPFHAKNVPASFNDTANSIREKAFLCKDMPLLIDDFHPTASMQEKRQMSATAQSLSRSYGDGVSRGRLNSDGTIRVDKPPRSVAIISGEDLPAVGLSGLARYYIIDVDKGDVPITQELTEVQEYARKGYLQKAMRGYIIWLQKQADGLPDRLHGLFLRYRDMIRLTTDGTHDRAPESVSCILIGYTLMLNYFRDIGLIDQAAAEGMLAHARQVLTETSRKQAAELASETPTRIFLDSLSELIAGRKVWLRDLTPGDGKPFTPPPGCEQVGYSDGDWVYLLPQVALGAVSKLCREQGIEFPVTLKGLYKSLQADGVISIPAGRNSMTWGKRIDSKVVRVLWIPRSIMDAPESAVKQESMSFTEETPADNPF